MGPTQTLATTTDKLPIRPSGNQVRVVGVGGARENQAQAQRRPSRPTNTEPSPSPSLHYTTQQLRQLQQLVPIEPPTLTRPVRVASLRKSPLRLHTNVPL